MSENMGTALHVGGKEVRVFLKNKKALYQKREHDKNLQP